MLKELKNSGLPIYMDESNSRLILKSPLTSMAFAEKKLSQMGKVIRNIPAANEEDIIYDFYRGIHDPADQSQFESDQYRYSITVIKPGMIGNEYKKTSGHYHSWNQSRTSTAPEVYEVICGTALYILQKADNFDSDNYEELQVDDLIVARVYEGQSIIVPPNYGHCSINIGEGPLVFSNIAYYPCKVVYEPVQFYHGMGVYVENQNGAMHFKKNNRYRQLPSIRYVEVGENKSMGIQFNNPIYNAYIHNPKAFDFLKNPEPYTNLIMDMLQDRKEGFL